MNKLKIINDPIYGFITIPSELIFDIIEHRYFQRLRRISQMGLSYLVYPGAKHTRFQHAIGCIFLMQKAINVLKFKGIKISDKEEQALLIAILLHDIGHGAFSHALEHSIVNTVSHEEISLKFMEALNKEFNGKLTLAIHIFKGTHKRNFLNQLIASQLDIDRLDYLKRDSFYTGVAEGNVNSERLITMLNVVADELVIEEKGIYSVEKFILARRLMYWQVYLHKTGLVAENMLVEVLKRAKELTKKGVSLNVSKALQFFLEKKINNSNFDSTVLENFSELDDYDIITAIKSWQNHKDFVLSYLSKAIIQRKLPKIILKSEKIDKEKIRSISKKVLQKYKVSKTELPYLIMQGKVTNQAYDLKSPIKIVLKNGELKDIVSVSDHFNLKTLSKPVVKYFISFPKYS
ncbi:MAG: HD domain-containing protein [Flavobacteriaceae bacterium]|nr:HD domain-containing protein [Flavobacteriaceae bacterium]